MKRILIFTICLFTLGSLGAEKRFLPGMSSMNPELWAEGYSVTATASGADALLTNPAGLARGTGGWQVSLNGTAFFPLGDLATLIPKMASGSFTNMNFTSPSASDTANIDYITKLVTTTGAGAYMDFQTTLVMGSFGLGFFVQGSSYAKGSTLLGTSADTDLQAALVLGLGYPLDLGFAKLNLGGNLKVFQRYHGNVPFLDFLTGGGNLMDSILFLNGYGMGVDLGALMDLGPWAFGLSIRDVGTVYQFKQNTMNEIVAGLGFPMNPTSKTAGTYVVDSNTYMVPWTLSAGAAYHHDMGPLKPVVDPRISFDVQIPLKDEFTQPSLWAVTHVGASVRLLEFLDVRTGLNQGYFTFGFGCSLGPWQTDFAVYTQELGRAVGDSPRALISLQSNLKF